MAELDTKHFDIEMQCGKWIAKKRLESERKCANGNMNINETGSDWDILVKVASLSL